MSILIEEAESAAEQLVALLEVIYEQGIDGVIPAGIPLTGLAYDLSAKVSNYLRHQAEIQMIKGDSD